MKRDLRINFSVVEEIAREISKYKTALADMEQAAAKMLRLLEEDRAQSIDKLKEIYKGFNKELQKCRTELEDLETIFEGYANEMQAIIRPVNKSAFMRVDRNDIYFNKQSIIQACEAVGFLPLEYNIGFGDFGIGLSEEQKAKEEQNYRKIEEICREVIPRYSRRLNAHIDELNHLYNRKIIPFEDKDDEYKNKADRLYSKYSNLWERIRTSFTTNVSDMVNFVRGLFKGVVDLVVGLFKLTAGVICYVAAAVVVAVIPPFIPTPKWADEILSGTHKTIGMILEDPMLLVEGISQGVSDAFEEEGIAYCTGYAVGSIAGVKGIDKLAKMGKVAILKNSGVAAEVLSPVEELLANGIEKIFTEVKSISRVGSELKLLTTGGVEISTSEIGLINAMKKVGMTEEIAKATVKYLEKTSIMGAADAEIKALLKSIDDSAMSAADKAALRDVVLKRAAAEAIEKFTANLKVRNILTKNADEVNEWWSTVRGYTNPPYTPGKTVIEFELEETTTFVRVYDDVNSFQKGGWLMKREDVAGLTPAQIKDIYALPSLPKYITDVEIPAGTKLRIGEANPLPGWGNGGGTQLDMMSQHNIGERFLNPRSLE